MVKYRTTILARLFQAGVHAWTSCPCWSEEPS
jgi:hypothetical protein